MFDGPSNERQPEGALWGWIAGIAVLVFIGFILIGGWQF
jgi:hypothetical protein